MKRLCKIQDLPIKRLMTALALLTSLLIASCKGDSQVLAEWTGGTITRGELRSAFKMVDGPQQIELQNRIITDLALLKMTAVEAQKAGMDKTDSFQKKNALFERLSYLGSLEQELVSVNKKKKFKMMEMQFAFLRDAAKPKERKPEADDLAKKLNEASEKDAEKIISQKTDMKRYSILGGYIDPLCTSCSFNPYTFLTDPARKADGKFTVIEDPNGYWIIRQVSEKEYSGDSLGDAFEGYFRKVTRIGRAAVAAMPDGPEKKGLESTVLHENQIEEMAKQQAKAQVGRESQGLLQKRLEEKRVAQNFEAGPILKDLAANKEVPKDAMLFKLKDKQYTMADFDPQIPDDTKDKNMLLQQVLLPYEILKDDELAEQAKKSEHYKFLMDWNRNNQLAVTYLTKQEPAVVTEQQIMERYKLRAQDAFKNQGFGQVHDQIKKDLELESRQQQLKKLQDELSKKFGLKIYREKLKEGEV